MRDLLVFYMALLLLHALPTLSEDKPALLLSDTQLGAQPDGFGGETPVVYGDLYNFGEQAYTRINILVDAYDADEELIGEGFGFLVDACGTALLDYVMPPEALQAYRVPFELFAEGDVARVQLRIDAETAAYEPVAPTESPAVRRIARTEVVSTQWLDDETLIYGVGCAGQVFTELEWWQYSVPDHALIAD